MRVVDPGHDYLLDSYDGGDPIRVPFMKREGEAYPGNVGAHAGTNMQEVLRMLINRGLFLDSQIPCDENIRILRYLRSTLQELEERAARRHGRWLRLSLLDQAIEQAPTCQTCGHIQCDQQSHYARRDGPST